MDKYSEIQAQIDSFQKELDIVNATLVSLAEDDPTCQEVCELKIKLEEILELTKNHLFELQKEELYEALDQSENELGKEGKNKQDKKTIEQFNDETNDELDSILDNLKGKICRAPYLYENGQIEYHTAMIMDIEEVIEDGKDFKIKVLFTHPIKMSMKTCPYYLDGNCKYSDSKCKYSHGFSVSLSQLNEYIEQDSISLEKDCKCLVKDDSTGIWLKAIVDQHLDTDQIVTNLTEESRTVTVSNDNIIPFYEDNKFEHSDDDNEECLRPAFGDVDTDDDSDERPVIAWDKINFQASALGEWEAYTKGIGSKLMKKMGYVWGSGLGKSSEGRVEPIEAVVLPAGKSLDYCIQFKERLKSKSGCKLDKAKLVQIAKGYHSMNDNVFNFLNKTLKSKFKKYKNKAEEVKKEINSKEFKQSLKSSTKYGLNVESFKISEEIRKAEMELLKIERGLERNESKDKLAYQNLYSKLKVQQKLIASLRQKEQSIEQEQKTRDTHKKLTNF